MLRFPKWLVPLLVLVVVAGSAAFLGVKYLPMLGAEQAQAATGDWTTYMYDAARSGFNAGETQLSPDNAANLKLTWEVNLSNTVAAQPIVKGDTVYVGAWDGYLYALNKDDGSVKWKANLGQTTSKRCAPQTAGITSAAVVTDNAIYIGGGDQYLYALKPSDGSVIWKFETGDNSEEGGSYNWASPLLYKDKVYYGTAAFCDQPFPHAMFYEVNAATGKADRQMSFLPGDFKGGGVWTSPAIDEATGDLYLTIGSGDYYVPYNYSMVRMDPKSFSVVDYWQIPIDDQVFDGDWGTTPTLFHDAGGKLMVGGAAKNGFYYAFDAHNIAAGPVWQHRIADGGQCPQCGDGAISSSVAAYGTVYVGAGLFSLGETQKFAGTVHAFDPATGAVKWIHPTSSYVIPAMVAANGLVVAAGGDTLELMRADTGELLWEHALESDIYAPPTVAEGMLFAASSYGHVYAFSAGPYPENSAAFKVDHVGGNPPGFTAFRKPVAAAKLQGEEQCFSDTGKCARGDFLKFWRDNGGQDRFGPAVTDELDEAGRTVQYFRNAVLAIYPNSSGPGQEVRYAKMDFRLFFFTKQNPFFDPTSEKQGATFVPETHHNLVEPFLTYWKTHGDVATLGYPVSEPFDEFQKLDGKVHTVQYFERSRLEVVKDADGTQHVVLGALGLEKYMQRYGVMP